MECPINTSSPRPSRSTTATTSSPKAAMVQARRPTPDSPWPARSTATVWYRAARGPTDHASSFGRTTTRGPTPASASPRRVPRTPRECHPGTWQPRSSAGCTCDHGLPAPRNGAPPWPCWPARSAASPRSSSRPGSPWLGRASPHPARSVASGLLTGDLGGGRWPGGKKRPFRPGAHVPGPRRQVPTPIRPPPLIIGPERLQLRGRGVLQLAVKLQVLIVIGQRELPGEVQVEAGSPENE